jgi:hypothetical protein
MSSNVPLWGSWLTRISSRRQTQKSRADLDPSADEALLVHVRWRGAESILFEAAVDDRAQQQGG